MSERMQRTKIEDIEGKIRSLARMRKTLEKLIAACSGDGPVTQCPILESLDSEPSTVDQKVKSYREEKSL